MLHYFELFDDVSLPGRWHVAEVLLRDGSEPLLRAGVRLEDDPPLRGKVSRHGMVPEFSLTSFAVPVATTRLADAICSVAGPDVQRLPLEIPGKPALTVLNSTRLVDCLDETRSIFTSWTERDHRADLAGQYRQVTRLVLARDSIPSNAHFFRVARWPIALIVSGSTKAEMERTGCLGAKFMDVTPAP